MTPTRKAAALALAVVLAGGLPAGAQELIDTSAGPMVATPLVEGLQAPWGFDTLPDGTILITERAGRLLAVRDGRAQAVAGLPEIAAFGQGGLLDVMVPRDFAQSRAVFFTFARPAFLRGARTSVFSARLADDGTALEDVAVIFESTAPSQQGRHFGSRVVEAADGTLFVTTGDRGDPDTAQDLDGHNGKVLRIARDGSVPDDNPFVDRRGARPEIWSYGHRNPQGAALDADGQLWTAEHGARGGDEVNRIAPGVNYGWPVISYGVNYNGTPIGQGTASEDMAQPVSYWDPSIAPSGMTFYDGAVTAWQGDAFVGSLNSDFIARLSGEPLAEVERISGDATLRVRDVGMGPDGALWFLSVGQGALFRLAPQG